MKHGWNSLENYKTVQDRVLRRYHKYMEEPRTLTYDKLAEEGPDLYVHCLKVFLKTYKGTLVRVDIEKWVEVDDSNRSRPQAKTDSYSYSANIPGGANLIRYCSPHQDWEEEGAASHHKFHHKHDYTINPPKAEILLIGEDEWPHISDFLEEIMNRF